MNSIIVRGSEWRKWDLHIHTPASIKQDYGSQNWDEFINALERLPTDVKVIGINDYYFIDGFEKVMEYKSQGRLSNIDKIFPVLEFRIDTFGSSSENKLQKINLHIIFDINDSNYKKDIEKIKKEFIEQVHLTKLKEHQTTCLSLANLINEGGSLDEGFANLVPSTDEVFRILNSEKWKDKVVLLLGYKEWSNLDKNNQLKPFKKDLYGRVNAFFTSNSDTLDKSKNWLDEFGDKALLHSADIHDFKLLTSPNYYCNTWIKADPTFEGLKQILYEPNQRVKIQELKPETKDNKLIIDEVKFISDKGNYFTSQAVKFNKSLNVIIGGKSSGKSILLYLIANALLKKEDESLLYKNEDIKNNLKYVFDNGLKLHVKIASGQDVLSDRDLNDASLIPEIKYIPQNYLSKLAEPEGQKTGNALRKLTRSLILEKERENNVYNDFILALKEDDIMREKLIDDFFVLYDNINNLHTQLSAKGNEGVLKTNIQENEKELEKLKKDAGLSAEEVEKYNELKEKLELNSIQLNKLAEDYKKIEVFNEKAKIDLGQLNADVDSLLKSDIDKDIIEYVKLFYKNIFPAHSDVHKLAELISLTEERQFVNDNLFSQKNASLTQVKNKLEEELKPYVKNEELKKKIKEIEEIVKQDKIKLSGINKTKIIIEEQNKLLLDKKEDIFTQIDITHSRYKRVIDDFKGRTSNLGEGIHIIGAIRYNFPKLRKRVEAISDKRSQSYREYKYLFDDKSGVSDYDLEHLLKELSDVFDGIIKDDYKIRDMPKKEAIKTLLYDYFFDNWDVDYRGDNLGKMSSGKASFVILMLIIGLSESKAPILIDQPEDNLDNRSITKDLVRFIREKKQERQIILVTHNPNIVVNADAENVIVANQKGQNDTETSSPYQFDYINGALENTFRNEAESDLLKSMGIREHVADIVEGGEEAFLKRERKYNFKR